MLEIILLIFFWGGAVVFGFTPGLWTIPETDDELHRQALSGERV